MNEREDRDERSHQRVWELLPWYVNGTLAGQDRERVEDHMAGCRRCQGEVESCRRTAAAIKGLGDVAPSPHPVQLQRMLARIDEAERHEWQERREEGAAVRFGAPLRALIAATPRPLRGALLAQVAVIVLLVGVLVWGELHSGASGTSGISSLPPVSYQTLSDPAPAPVPGGTVALHLMFSPRATEKQIRELLLNVHGEITAGPSPIGIYTVEVSAAGHPVSAVLAFLRSEPVVTFAEPAAGGRPVRGDR
ncbi:MAG: zf-HC2 domain-containing protein [Acidobacteria bacterium]|nr:zf-HC2 domain-containing protein [Acidobacteriota bacterium]